MDALSGIAPFVSAPGSGGPYRDGMPVAIHWFRRDLRLTDNTALSTAGKLGPVLPVFILDPEILQRPDTGPARFAFLCAGLRALEGDLLARGSKLLVRRGEPATVLREIARRHRAAGLFFNRDYEPYAIARDARVTSVLQSEGVFVNSCKDDVIAELGELPGPRPFRVFTPFHRAWVAGLTTERRAERAGRGDFVPGGEIESDPLPRPAELPGARAATIPEAGPRAGTVSLERFTRHGLASYADDRDRLDREDTSRLSYFLRFGMV